MNSFYICPWTLCDAHARGHMQTTHFKCIIISHSLFDVSCPRAYAKRSYFIICTPTHLYKSH